MTELIRYHLGIDIYLVESATARLRSRANPPNDPNQRSFAANYDNLSHKTLKFNLK